jgi:hypothetical protein
MLGKELLVRLGLDGSGYSLGLKRMESMTARWGRSLRNNIMGYVGAAFSINMVTRGIKDLREFADKVGDIAMRTGLSTDEVQAFNYVISQTGLQIDDLATSFDFLNDKMQEAFTNSKSESAKAFRTLGIDLNQYTAKDVGKVFQEISRAVQSMGTTTESVGAVRDLLGRSGGKMIPAMRNGLAGVTSEIKQLGGVIDENLIWKIKEASDAWTTMLIRFRAMTAPVMTEVYKMFGFGMENVMAQWKFLGKIPGNVQKMGIGNLVGAIITSAKEAADEIENAVKEEPMKTFGKVTPLPEPPASDVVTKIVRSVIDPSLSGMSRQGIFLRGLPAGEQNIPKLQLNELKKIEKNTKDKGETVIVK